MQNKKILIGNSLVIAALNALSIAPALATTAEHPIIDIQLHIQKYEADKQANHELLSAINFEEQVSLILNDKSSINLLNENFEVLSKNYGIDGKTIQEKYQLVSAGNDDSTGAGTTGSLATICHSQCHNLCHGARGWR